MLSKSYCKLRLVLLDFDGTVVDTMSFYTEEAARIISRYTGISLEEARSFYRSTVGRAFREQLRLAGVPSSRLEEAARVFEEWKKKLLVGIELHPDLVKLILLLRRSGLKVFVTTNNECSVVSRAPRLTSVFDKVLCYDKVERKWKGKPHLEEILLMGFRLEEVLFVGDSSYDIELYRKLGVKTLRTRGLWDKSDEAYRFLEELAISRLEKCRT